MVSTTMTRLRPATALKSVYAQASMASRRTFASKTTPPSVTVSTPPPQVHHIPSPAQEESLLTIHGLAAFSLVPILPQLHEADRKDPSPCRVFVPTRVLDLGKRGGVSILGAAMTERPLMLATIAKLEETVKEYDAATKAKEGKTA
ncbi:hypothetical protein ACJZ2D_005005 [Fusarium nematophilum]